MKKLVRIIVAVAGLLMSPSQGAQGTTHDSNALYKDLARFMVGTFKAKVVFDSKTKLVTTGNSEAFTTPLLRSGQPFVLAVVGCSVDGPEEEPRPFLNQNGRNEKPNLLETHLSHLRWLEPWFGSFREMENDSISIAKTPFSPEPFHGGSFIRQNLTRRTSS